MTRKTEAVTVLNEWMGVCENGAGEFKINSIIRDGSQKDFDIPTKISH